MEIYKMHGACLWCLVIVVLTMSLSTVINYDFFLKKSLAATENLHWSSLSEKGTKKDAAMVTNPETHLLALSQTLYARNLIYHPDDILTDRLKLASSMLLKFIKLLDVNLTMALGGRLINKEGILPYQDATGLGGSLERVNNSINVTATDRVVVIALMGDIGALLADTGATTAVYNRSEEQTIRLRKHLMDFVNTSFKGEFVSRYVVEKLKQNLGSQAVGPNKTEERDRTHLMMPRTGIFNYGTLSDAMLSISELEAIPKTTSRLPVIESARLNTTEPWTGHMSGSPSEILHIWDVFDGEDPVGIYNGTCSNDKECTNGTFAALARAAGASAFLIAMGYHTAVECIEGVRSHIEGKVLSEPVYKCTDKNCDDGKLDAAAKYPGNQSTVYMMRLFDNCTKVENRIHQLKLMV